MSDKIIFNIKSISRDEKRYFIMIKWPIPEKDITILKVYVFNNKTPKYMMQKLTELMEDIDIFIIISRYLALPCQ